MPIPTRGCLDAPIPVEPLARGLPGSTSSSSSWLHPLKSWSLRESRGGSKQSIIESYGATSIDYQSVGVNEYVAQHTNGDGFDIIYDTVGGESLDLSFQAIRPYGHVVSCAAFSSHNLAPGSLRCMTLSGVFVLLPMLSGKGRSHHGEILRKAAQLAEAGQLKPLVDEFRFTLSQAQTAHEMLERGDVRGKAVIDID
ncbi:zinc-binding dehydrogenase [Stutzerimonas nitrititolerans]|uniref:zinc-binding dehydrogenase n=1 Tax=Stutzerimonas nitrititolerans TaxID=2482751 RepID=UPI00289DEDF0|nr:zinc-binding dehydrogenase [Stutzerimonas nitrititolerans]